MEIPLRSRVYRFLPILSADRNLIFHREEGGGFCKNWDTLLKFPSTMYFYHYSITFCGITMKNYVERNISSKSQTTLKYAMKMLSGSSETIIFMFLGVATIHDNHDWNTWFVVLTILFCTVFRVIGVLILTGEIFLSYKISYLIPTNYNL